VNLNRVLWIVVALVALAGCANVTSHRNPAVDLGRYQRFYVERRLADNQRLDELIVQELRRLGREATNGPLTMKPDGIDAIVTYTDRWAWDFKTYLIELNIEMRDARTNKSIMVGRFYQPSMRTKSPPDMIHELLAPHFASNIKPARP
jgi:hypothetical protein